MVEGVAQVNVYGSMKYAVRVQLDPAKLASLGISVSQVANQIGLNNVMLPTGVLYGRDTDAHGDGHGPAVERDASSGS